MNDIRKRIDSGEYIEDDPAVIDQVADKAMRDVMRAPAETSRPQTIDEFWRDREPIIVRSVAPDNLTLIRTIIQSAWLCGGVEAVTKLAWQLDEIDAGKEVAP